MAQTILVADDSSTMRRVVAMAFKGSSYRVVAVGGGEEALQAAYEHRPNIVLLDYHLPDRSGLEVCRAMKGDPSLRHIPILMMGGSYHAFNEDEARRSGSDDIIIKPFRTDDVHEKVARLATAGAQAPVAHKTPAAPSSTPVRSSMPTPAVPTPAASLRAQPPRGGTQMGMPAVGSQPQPPRRNPLTPTSPAPSQNQARYGGTLPPPGPRRDTPAARFKSPGEPTRPAVSPPPRQVQAPAQPAQSAGVAPEEIRRLVREEVQRAVREEMLSMVKSVLGDLFKERMMPKLLSYGQERVETIVTRDLQVLMERRVEEELARITGE